MTENTVISTAQNIHSARNIIAIGNDAAKDLVAGRYNIFIGNGSGKYITNSKNHLEIVVPKTSDPKSIQIQITKKISKLQWYLFNWILKGSLVVYLPNEKDIDGEKK